MNEYNSGDKVLIRWEETDDSIHQYAGEVVQYLEHEESTLRSFNDKFFEEYIYLNVNKVSLENGWFFKHRIIRKLTEEEYESLRVLEVL